MDSAASHQYAPNTPLPNIHIEAHHVVIKIERHGAVAVYDEPVKRKRLSSTHNVSSSEPEVERDDDDSSRTYSDTSSKKRRRRSDPRPELRVPANSAAITATARVADQEDQHETYFDQSSLTITSSILQAVPGPTNIMATAFSSLPTELITLIWSQVLEPKDVESFAVVSKRILAFACIFIEEHQ